MATQDRSPYPFPNPYPPKPGLRGGMRKLLDRRDARGRARELASSHASVLGELASCVLGSGNAILFGITSDGGALSLTIYYGDERFREYLSSPEELQLFAEALADMVNDSGPTQSPTPNPKPIGKRS